MITETDEVAQALDDAAERWPDDRASRGKLLMRVIEEGHRALRQQSEDAIAKRKRAIERSSGMFTGVYPDNYLAELRKDWPE